MNTSLIRQILPVALAIGLLWYVLKDVPFAELASQFKQADYRWLALVSVCIGLYHLTRAARWQLTLQAMGYQPSLFRTTVALLAGTMASMIIPGAGELTRCGTLQRTDGVPIAKGLGSVVGERVIDLLMLGVLVGLTFFIELKRVGQFLTDLFNPILTRITSGGQSELIMIGFIGVCLLGAGLVYWLVRQQTVRQNPFVKRIALIALNIGQGIIAIKNLKRPGLFIGLTVANYILAFLITYFLFFASAETVSLPPAAALTILTVSSLGGLAVPTQGGLGTYHFLVSRVLVLYGMTLTKGVVVATFLHAVQTGFSLVLSSLSFLIIPILLTNRPAKEAESLVK
ncbi:lysylphosphatidylglycerol synthase transmembrane domain-containing protein [Spirosoma panaciterrae]|uniref:lysylphosphatidylglycerol synthase transmembrane domain-containing protein n=1 Tax=Spirosoma panaciterrae TaxID=496058 RepID=UPI00036D3B4D|nr:lysylphosphatidylglycerol synthase transmembrane domain-containing protein [Spirosoma panaciterrae]